jgi:hypothetical protein
VHEKVSGCGKFEDRPFQEQSNEKKEPNRSPGVGAEEQRLLKMVLLTPPPGTPLFANRG